MVFYCFRLNAKNDNWHFPIREHSQIYRMGRYGEAPPIQRVELSTAASA